MTKPKPPLYECTECCAQAQELVFTKDLDGEQCVICEIGVMRTVVLAPAKPKRIHKGACLDCDSGRQHELSINGNPMVRKARKVRR